ncbi:MAG: single-stranded DNA-binding protein [Candidatus Nomurabacteria bacterium]|jgi:single-strand DNA-binding protein|nr:single-stranded DNA-binding protein [Candidatus Nomurabacteria bacterium]
MARGFSKAIIMGNLTRDPEMRSTPSGAQVCGFSVAVNRTFKDSSGQQQEAVSFIDCSAWGRAGEIIAQYTKKGSGIMVSGRLDQRSWEDKEGQKRSRVEIIVEDFNFIGGNNALGAGDSNGGRATASSNTTNATPPSTQDVAPDDISDDPIDLSEIPF